MNDGSGQFSPLYASMPMIFYHHDQLWAGTPGSFLDHLYHDFDYRADDIRVSSYPRSGTAWTYEVLYAVLHGGDIAGMSSELGLVGPKGIRCCYHSWLFDVDGTILEPPGEPAESTLKARLCHGAYPVDDTHTMFIEFRHVSETQGRHPGMVGRPR